VYRRAGLLSYRDYVDPRVIVWGGELSGHGTLGYYCTDLQCIYLDEYFAVWFN